MSKHEARTQCLFCSTKWTISRYAKFCGQSCKVGFKLESLEAQLTNMVNRDCSQCVHNHANGDGWCGECNTKLKQTEKDK